LEIADHGQDASCQTADRAAIKRGIAAKKAAGARAGKKVSAASRATMAKAQREQWAKVKKSGANKK
jgi:hypothetical protein